MNILVVSEVYLPTVSGVATSTDSICRFLLSRGHTVTLLCPRYANIDSTILPKGMNIVYAPSVSDPFFVGKPMTIFPFGTAAVLRLFLKERFDIIHIQEPASLGITALILSKFFHIPTVGAMHFSLEQVALLIPRILYFVSKIGMRLFIRLVYPLYDGIMVPTETVVSVARGILGVKKDIRAVSNGVDTTIFVPVRSLGKNIVRKKWLIPENQTVFIYIGRIDKDKNVETTIRALMHTRLTVHLVIAGIGKHGEALSLYAKKLGLSSRITWIGRVNINEMVELYQASDCFVITSPVETQSIVALQAISCGLPMIAANAGALPELVKNGENGYLVPAYDDKEIGRRMDELSSVALRKTMGAKSREMSLLHHKPTALLKLEEFYKDILAERVRS